MIEEEDEAPIIDLEEPEESDEEAEILARAKKDWTRCEDRWAKNRLHYVDDIRFARLGEQWDEAYKRARTDAGRPSLTINRLPPFIRQVVNDARQNKPSIKVLPQDSGADPEVAEIYSGLIRNIENSSDADVAYDTALECAASGGFGFFRLNTAYADDRSFNQDIVFERIANPLAVYPDPDTQAADSSDWDICFIADWMSKRAFRKRYGTDEQPVNFETPDWDGGWKDGESVLVAEYWVRKKVEKRLLALTTGDVVVEGEYEPEEYLDGVTGLPAEVDPEIEPRVIIEHEVYCYKLTGDRVLETTRWPGKYIPVIPVYGEEVNLEGERFFRSLIRDAKDAQVLYNVSRTASAEFIAMAPKAPFVVEEGSVVDPDKWTQANVQNYAYLEYKAGRNAPQRQAFPSPPTGPLQEALTSSDEMKTIIGIYDAGMGARSNETSGRAIMARQRESDTSTFHFIDNLSRAIRHAGRIIIDLIPHIYTPGRVIRILGEDGTPDRVPVGTPEQMEQARQAQMMMQAEQVESVQKIYALGMGKYDLTVTVGPAFNSRREEAATQMIELIRAYPDAAPLIGDLLAKNLDWPGAEKIAERFEAMQSAQSQPQAPVIEQPDPAQMAKAQIDQFNAQVKAQQGQQKLEIDAFKAETDRMNVAARLSQPTRLRTPEQAGF